MAERWLPVPSLPGWMASDRGRVLLPPRHQALPNGGFRRYLPEPVEGTITRSNKDAAHVYRGYWTRDHGNVKLHRVVCEAFHGPAPFDGAVVMHLNEDALDNRPDNLRWGTQKENQNAPGFKAYCRSRVGARSPRAIWAAKRAAA